MAGDVGLECRALVVARLGVLEYFVSQSDVSFHHLPPVLYSAEVEIVRGNEETNLLTVAGVVEPSYLCV